MDSNGFRIYVRLAFYIIMINFYFKINPLAVQTVIFENRKRILILSLMLSFLDDSLAYTWPVNVHYHIEFDWKMNKRFGLDENHNGLLDVPNSFNYVNPDLVNNEPTFVVQFESRRSHIVIDRTIFVPEKYVWIVRDLQGNQILTHEEIEKQPNIPIFQLEARGRWTTKLKEGVYELELKISKRIQGIIYSSSRTDRININDILVVSLGDSFASGEGNPEKGVYFTIAGDVFRNVFSMLVYWADDGKGIDEAEQHLNNLAITSNREGAFHAADQLLNYLSSHPIQSSGATEGKKHRAAHRSTLSAHAQVALQLENLSHHSSVTFLFLSTSGSTIKRGLFTQQTIDPNEIFNHNQIGKMKSLIGKRDIDVLLLSIGINDIGFSNLVKAMEVYPQIYHHIHSNTVGTATYYDKVISAFNSGDWQWFRDNFNVPGPGGQIQFSDRTGFIDLNAGFKRIMDSLKGLTIHNIYLTQYPFLGKSASGAFCENIVSSVVGASNPFGWNGELTASELDFLYNQIFRPFQNQLEAVSDQFKWVLVDGVENAFERRGLCQNDPSYDFKYGGYPGNRNLAQIEEPNSNTRFGRRAIESMYIQGPFELDATKGTFHPNEYGHQEAKKIIFEHINLPGITPFTGKTLSKAHTLRTDDMDILPVPDQLSSYSDINIYKVYISKAERIYFLVNKNSFCQLFDSKGSRIPLESSNFLAPKDSFAFAINVPGYYYLGISISTNKDYDPITGGNTKNPYFGSSSFPYDRDINKKSDLQIRYKNDPDGGFPGANIISLNLVPGRTVVSGHAIEHDNDEDFFRIRISNPDTFFFEAKNEPDSTGLLPHLKLFDSNHNLLGEADRKLTYTFSSAADYYISISSQILGISSMLQKTNVIELGPQILTSTELKLLRDSTNIHISEVFRSDMLPLQIRQVVHPSELDLPFAGSSRLPNGLRFTFTFEDIKKFIAYMQSGALPSLNGPNIMPVKTRGRYSLVIGKQ